VNFFKLYIGDYQRDTGALSLAEHGAYLMMLQHYYATEQPLPVGAPLYRLMRAQTKAERKAIDVVASRFWLVKDGALVNTRAVVEIDKASAQADTNRAIARAREAKRKVKPTEHESFNEPSTNRVTNDQPNQTPDTRQEPDQKQNQPPAAPAALRRSPPMPDVPDWIDAEAWAGFVAMRQRERHPLTPRGAQLVIRKLERLRADGTSATDALDQSTRNGWRDVYPARPDASGVARGAVAPVSQSRTLTAIQTLEGMKNGLADNRDSDGAPKIALLGARSNAGH